VVVVCGCPPRPVPPRARELDALAQRRTTLEVRLNEADARVRALLEARDEALWRHFTTRAPLELGAATAARERFLDAGVPWLLLESAALGGHQRELAQGLWRLERGERLALALADVERRLDEKERSLMVRSGTRELPWREVATAISAEASAVTRKELWQARAAAAPAVLELLVERSTTVAEVLGPDAGACALRGLTCEQLAMMARDGLEVSDGGVVVGLESALAQELRLPPAQVGRPELLRALRSPPEEDRALDVARAGAALHLAVRALGLDADGGVLLDVTASPIRHPLPLAVPLPPGVRVSIRPAPGVGPLGQALAELGRAAAWARHPGQAAWQLEVEAEAAAQLSKSLLTDDGFLAAVGVDARLGRAVAARAQRSQALEQRQRAAACLVSLAERAGGEGAATQTFRELEAQALGLGTTDADAALWRLDSDPVLTCAVPVQGAARVRSWRRTLPPRWWSVPGTFAALLRGAPLPAPPMEAPAPDGGTAP
ncbi:MAG: hypothetical protein K1X89_30660, partial [Myxococcaceae bacterium]|nr:hypothetical protein [Myxococcaceae bacterium]